MTIRLSRACNSQILEGGEKAATNCDTWRHSV